MKKPSTTSGIEKQFRVLVVDDHPLYRQGVAQLLNHQKDLACCGEANSVASAPSAVKSAQPDIVLLDLRLGRGDGLDLIKTLQTQFPKLPILVLSQHDEPLYAERALQAGAMGYIMKEDATEEVLDGVRSVLRGELYVSRKMATSVLQKLLHQTSPRSPAGVDHLSGREFQVLQMLGFGMSTRQIAADLKLSIKTIESHRENLKHKLGLCGAPELVRYAADWVRDRSLPSPRK